MFQIIRANLKERKYAIFGFCIIAILFAFVYVSIYPTFQKQLGAIEPLLKAMPKEMMKAIGVKDLGFSTFESFISSEYMTLLWPILCIFLVVTGSVQTIVAEIENRTMALVLSLPISRMKIYIAKYIALLVQIGIYILVSILGVIPLAAMFNVTYHASYFLLFSFVCLLFALGVSGISFFFSSIFSRKSLATSFSYVIILGMYVVNIISTLTTNLDKLKYFSFFYYYNPGDIMTGAGMVNGAVYVFLSVAIIGILAGGMVYSKKDITI